MSTQGLQVLVIEDNEKMATAVRNGLVNEGCVVDVSHGGFEGEELAATQKYEIVLLDLMLPDRDGVEICRNLRKRGVTSKIIMLTALGATQEKVTGLDAGADDYITKPFEFNELLARMRELLRRANGAEGRSLKVEDLELDLYSHVARRDGEKIELSNREFALLEYFMRNRDRVLSRAQISEKVWDMNFESSSNVVDVYVSALRRKLGRGPERELIHTIKGVGYRFGGNEPN